MSTAKTTYGAAIEFTGLRHQLCGLFLCFGIICASATAHFGITSLIYDVEKFLAAGELSIIGWIYACFSILFIAISIWMLLKTIRLDLFRPGDEPIIFDRRNRKVYRQFREIRGGIAGLFRRWPLLATEYEWDLIDAEHMAILTATGSTVARHHYLMFVVRRSTTDPTIIDSFTVGDAMVLGELTVAPLWEHIRRFMEEDGPHFPLGETVNVEPVPATLWQSMGAVGPFGSRYFWWWKEMPFTTAIMHVLSPIFLPLGIVWGICNRLSFMTMTEAGWPQEVIDAVGPPIQPNDQIIKEK